MATQTLSSLDSRTLARRLSELASDERQVQVEFLLHLEEFDRRRAFLELGHGSLWAFCLTALHLREGSADGAGRKARPTGSWQPGMAMTAAITRVEPRRGTSPRPTCRRRQRHRIDACGHGHDARPTRPDGGGELRSGRRPE